MKLLKLILITIILVSMIVGIGLAEEKIKVAFIYGTPHNDGGWAQKHDEGRIYLENTLPYVVTNYSECVPEDSSSEKVIRDYCNQGYDVIFTCGFGYMNFAYNVAQEYPDVIFQQCTGYLTAKNMSVYFGKAYQPTYLSGLVAGMMTKSNYIGFVSAFSIANVRRRVNAFTIGVREVNPNAKVHLVWLNTWFDPGREAEAARTFIANGADVIAIHMDDPSVMIEAEKAGIWGIGWDSDMSIYAPDTVLTSPVWNWGPYYVQVLEDVYNGTWKSESYWGEMSTGIIDLAPYGPMVPNNVIEYVEKRRQEILDGTFEPFTGPLYDQDGNLLLKDNEEISQEELLKIEWVVEGVVGSVK